MSLLGGLVKLADGCCLAPISPSLTPQTPPPSILLPASLALLAEQTAEFAAAIFAQALFTPLF